MTTTSKIKVPPIDPKTKAEFEELDRKIEVLIQKRLPETLSIEESVAAMINLPYITEDGDVEGILENFLEAILEESEINSINASDKHTAAVLTTINKIHFHRLQLAKLIKEALQDELDSLAQGYESKIRVDIFTNKPHEIATSSLVEWADELNFGIKSFRIRRGWRNFRDRKYSTDYLEIIEHVIREFYEEGGSEYIENHVPPNKKIQSFIEKKYENIPEHMIESICTILKKQPPKINGPIIKTGTTTIKVGDTGNRIVTNKIR